ncbi:phage holin family protein [Neorhodopirellula lusitana]|uniref:phage holin family protein n=1 Tax=Neorhodopirellula lusitana TaxID=445327 RepID=UPI00384DAD38
MNKNSSFQRVLRDVVDLCELQMQLISVDSQDARRRATTAAIVTVIAVAIVGSALTTTMIGAGYLIHELADWSVGASLLTVAATTLAIAGMLLLYATKSLRRAAASLRETKSEFVENLKWIKSVLITPDDSPRNQLRTESFPDWNEQRARTNHLNPRETSLNQR